MPKRLLKPDLSFDLRQLMGRCHYGKRGVRRTRGMVLAKFIASLFAARRAHLYVLHDALATWCCHNPTHTFVLQLNTVSQELLK